MAIVIRRPGSKVTLPFPSQAHLPVEEQSKVRIKIPDEETIRKVVRIETKLARREIDELEAMRRKWGLYVDGIENLTFEGGGECQVEHDGDGGLTMRCLVELVPLAGEIGTLIDSCSRLSETDRKNSQSPSPSASEDGLTTAGT